MSDTQTEAEAAPTEEETTPPTVEEELAQLLPDPSDAAAKTAVVTRLLDETLDIVEYMKPVDLKNKRRIRLYLLLAGLGVPNKDIADYLGVTAESVRQALLKARRGRDGS